MCRGPGTIRRPVVYDSTALPTELPRQLRFRYYITKSCFPQEKGVLFSYSGLEEQYLDRLITCRHPCKSGTRNTKLRVDHKFSFPQY